MKLNYKTSIIGIFCFSATGLTGFNAQAQRGSTLSRQIQEAVEKRDWKSYLKCCQEVQKLSNDKAYRRPLSAKESAFRRYWQASAIMAQALIAESEGDMRSANANWKLFLRHQQELLKTLPGNKLLLADISDVQGHIAETQGDLNTAARYYREAIKLDPAGHWDSLLLRAPTPARVTK